MDFSNELLRVLGFVLGVAQYPLFQYTLPGYLCHRPKDLSFPQQIELLFMTRKLFDCRIWALLASHVAYYLAEPHGL